MRPTVNCQAGSLFTGSMWAGGLWAAGPAGPGCSHWQEARLPLTCLLAAALPAPAGTQRKLAVLGGWQQHYERAMAVCPTYAPARYNLGAPLLPAWHASRCARPSCMLPTATCQYQDPASRFCPLLLNPQAWRQRRPGVRRKPSRTMPKRCGHPASLSAAGPVCLWLPWPAVKFSIVNTS